MTPVKAQRPDAVTFIDASFGYRRKPVLTDVNATLPAGQAMALLGPNGSGKTTLLRGILGAVQQLDGTVDVDRSSIGYVPQSADLDLTFPVTARRVVEMGLYREVGSFGRIGRTRRRRVTDALERVGMADKAKRRFGELSGGQRQRVLVARALVAHPTLVLLDEPFNGLDDPTRRLLLRIIAEIKSEGIAVISSTHDLALARETCEMVMLLAGHQIAVGPLNQVLTDENLRLAYGGDVTETQTGPVTLTSVTS